MIAITALSLVTVWAAVIDWERTTIYSIIPCAVPRCARLTTRTAKKALKAARFSALRLLRRDCPDCEQPDLLSVRALL